MTNSLFTLHRARYLNPRNHVRSAESEKLTLYLSYDWNTYVVQTLVQIILVQIILVARTETGWKIIELKSLFTNDDKHSFSLNIRGSGKNTDDRSSLERLALEGLAFVTELARTCAHTHGYCFCTKHGVRLKREFRFAYSLARSCNAQSRDVGMIGFDRTTWSIYKTYTILGIRRRPQFAHIKPITYFGRVNP